MKRSRWALKKVVTVDFFNVYCICRMDKNEVPDYRKR